MPRARIEHLRTALAMWLVLALVGPASAKKPVRIIAGPMFTSTSDSTVFVWVQLNRAARIECEYLPPHSIKEIEDSMRLTFQTQPMARLWGNRHIYWTPIPIDDNRRLDRDFALSIRLAGSNDEPIGPSGGFKAPPPPSTHGKYTIAFGSCSHQEKFPRHQPIWEVVVTEEPDCFLFIGDNIYLPNRADEYPKTRDEVFKLYCDTYDRQRRIPEMQPLLRSTMSFALWDDHDYGPNNSDRTWPWKDVALEALNLYFPNKYGLPDAPGAFYKFAWGDIDVFMLDDRTFRDPNNDPDRKTFLGVRQLAWFKEGLAASKATFKLIVCGNQILSDTHPHESWGTQFRPERDAFLDWLWEKKISGVIFLAGDRHFAELVRKKDPKNRGPDLWELTSSPLANNHYKDGPTLDNPDRIAAYADGVNVGVLKFDTLADPPRVELTILDVSGKPVIRQNVTNTPRR